MRSWNLRDLFCHKQMFTNFIRRFNTTRVFWSTETSLLSKLRKKTGYTFANCKKALEMHNNDLNKAEEWLHKQAQDLGWAKATKLAGRSTSQGLVAVKYDGSHAALVELNCETDFVARNEKFQSMVEEATNTCFKYANSNLKAKGLLTKICLDAEQLGALHSTQGKTLAEQLVLMIGAVGENAALRRAECWKASPGLYLSAYTHPPTVQTLNYSTGKYGGILAFTSENNNESAITIGKQLCQHIVGMNPTKIGNETEDKPDKNSDDESCLIYQEFLSDPELIVNDILKEHKVHVHDFVRFECGENLDILKEHVQQPLDTVQTCQ